MDVCLPIWSKVNCPNNASSKVEKIKKLAKQSWDEGGTVFQVIDSSEKAKYSHNDNLLPESSTVG